MSRDKIRSLRKLRKLSQAALGGICGLTGAEISRIECGYRDLSPTEAAAIAAALSVPLDTLSMVTANGSPHASPVVSANGINKAMGLAAAITAKPINTLESKPVGSDLSDPVNFGVLPDPGVLEQGSQSAAAFRSRLSAEVDYANKILHASRIPAAVWRAWREFERRLAERLRVPFVEPVTATQSAAPSPSRSDSRSSNALFVEAARDLLPPDVMGQLNSGAEASYKANPSIGFMKHFRQSALAELTSEELTLIDLETDRRLSSPERWRARRGRKQLKNSP